ncbi:MAG: TonB-dependent receptor, partial [Verrucomicrobia bacterium]|nr:TonB-dependent receptor [Verrucomicrobiota bacterium]
MNSSFHSRAPACHAAALLLLCAGPGLRVEELRAAEPPQAATKTNLMEISLDELLAVKVQTVISAAKYAQPTALAPASVTIVTDRDIQLHGYRNLTEVLGSVRGFTATYDRNYHYLGIRGFNRPGDYNSRVLLLIDGHRVNDVVYDGAPIGNDGYLDVDLIDRVEVVRGPGSAVYGSSAFFGVVNVITRRGRDMKGAEAALTVGAFDTYQGRFSLGQQLTNGVEFLLSGTVRESEGHRQLSFPAGSAVGLDGESGRSLFARIGVPGLELTGGFVTRTKQIPTGSYGTDFGVAGSQTRDDKAFADLKMQRRWEEPGVDLLARLYYDYDRYRGYYIYTGARNVDPAEGQRWGAEVQVTKEIGERHKVSAGLDFRNSFQIQQENFTEVPFTLNFSDSRQSTVISPYITSQWQLRSNLTFHAGARLDYFDNATHSANPRLGLVWQPVDGTVLKGLYGTAFRAANAYELQYNDGMVTQKPALSLRPETVDTYELVWEQALGRHWHFTSSAYFYEINNAITQITDPADGLLVFRNTGQNTGRGVENELAYKSDNGFCTRLSYVFSETEDRGTGAALSNSPKHLARWHNTLPLHADKVFIGTELTYTSPVQTSATSASPGRVGGYWLLNATLYTRELVRGWSASVSVHNLLDRRYQNAVGDEI